MSRSINFAASLAAVAALRATSAAEPAAPAAPVPAPPPAATATATVDIKTPDTTVATPPVATAPPADGKAAEPTPGKQIAILEEGAPPETRVDTVAQPTKPVVQPKPTPRFELAAGAFVQSRGMDFDYDPFADGGPPSYPASNVKGFALSGAVYPMPLQQYDGKLSGIGFSFKLAKSAGSTIVASDDTGTGEYEVDHSMYEAGLHYRYPIDKFAIDGELSYGNWSHAIIDLPDSIEIPDTSYSYIGVGGHVDIYPTERASIGFGAKYMSIMSSGDVTAQDWYGAGSAQGLVLDADVKIPLPSNLFLKGGVEWRKVWIDFDGSGDLSYYYGVGTMTDQSITGTAQIGVEF